MTTTLDEFIDHFMRQENCAWPTNAYVDEPGFKHLYVRITPRYIDGVKWPYVLDLANMETNKPGTGVFKAFIHRIREKYPQLGLYVENVLNPQFRDGLIRMGFSLVPTSHPLTPCYFVPPHKLPAWMADK